MRTVFHDEGMLSLFFPPISLLGEDGAYITESERMTLLRSEPVVLDAPALKERGMLSVHRLVAAAEFDRSPLLRTAVHRWKYRHVRALDDVLGAMIVRVAGIFLQHHGYGDPSHFHPGVCPVPLHWTRRFARGFNQSAVLALALANAYAWPFEPCIARIRPTGHQAQRARNERLLALGNAFAFAPRGQPPSRIILIDDVCTTGATLEACAFILRTAGVQRVDAAVLGITL